jgi:putative transposase
MTVETPGMCKATFYNWNRKYGGLGVSELRRLRQLEEENVNMIFSVLSYCLYGKVGRTIIKE